MDLPPPMADTPTIHALHLPNGLRVVIEEMPSVRTCAVALHIPGGAAADPEGPAGEGASALLAELVQRGAGERDSRRFAQAIDALGASIDASASTVSTSIGATGLAESAAPILELLFDIARRPRIDDAEVEPARALALQELKSIHDAPAQLAMMELRRVLFPAPLNRSSLGDAEGLLRWEGPALRERWRATTGPSGAVLAVAGGIAAVDVSSWVAALSEGWAGRCPEPVATCRPLATDGHIEHPGAQTVISQGVGGLLSNDPDLLAMRLLVHVLGGASSSRLFMEVRERRGLCYGVGAEVAAGIQHGATFIHASSTPERAATTLAVIREQLALMARGITREEFDRAVVGFKSGIVFSGESCRSRASSILADVLRGKRARSLEQIAAEVDALTLDGVNEVAARRLGEAWLGSLVQVTVGPSAPGAPA